MVCHELEPALDEFRTLFASGPGDVDPTMVDFGLQHEVLQVGKDTYLEICAPLDPTAVTAATKFLGRGGEGGYMAVIQVPDAEVLRARLGDAGLTIAHVQKHHGNELTQLHPREFGTLLEADEIGGPEDWHYPVLEGAACTDVTSGIVATDIAVADPAAMAVRWAQIFDLDLDAAGSSVTFGGGGVVRFVQSEGSRGGVVSFDVHATDRGRAGETHTIGGLSIRFT